jgi:hypothetical protein
MGVQIHDVSSLVFGEDVLTVHETPGVLLFR